MDKFKSLAAQAIGGLVILVVFLLFVFKSCVVTVWFSPSEATSYVTEGEDDRSIRVIFMANNETVIVQSDPSEGSTEVVLAKMRGTPGTHYFGRLWRIEGPGIYFGFRIYPADTKPVVMEIEVLQKYKTGPGDSSFPKIGEMTYSVILFGNDVIRWDGMWLSNAPTDPYLVEEFLSKLRNR